MFLRLVTIPHWMAIHYALAAFIMVFAAPSQIVLEIEKASGGIMTNGVWGGLFAFCALMLLIDNYMPPYKFRLYLLAWLTYLIAVVTIAFRTLITDEVIPGFVSCHIGLYGGNGVYDHFLFHPAQRMECCRTDRRNGTFMEAATFQD